MALRGLFQYRNQDSTKDLNDRFGGLVIKGVFDPGTTDGAAGNVTTPVVQPIAGQLNVEILSFVAVGNDGMAIVHETPPTTIVAVQANLTQYVLLRSSYTPGGTPDLAFEVLSSAAYNALVTSDKNKRIKLAKITLGPGATEVTSGDIDLRENDIVDKANRSFIRGVVAAAADLPVDGPTEIQRVQTGDVYLAVAERQFYRYDSGAWQTVTDGAVSTLLNQHLNVSSYEMPAFAHPGTAIRNIPAGNIAATNTQTAINELDTEKVAKAGDTMTGKLTITNAGADHALQATAGPGGFSGGVFTGSTGAAGMVAVAGSGSDGAQVFGNGAGIGLLAKGGNTNGPGVVGVADAGATPVLLNAGVQGHSAVIGVYGDGGSTGVWGNNTAGGDGVYGEGALNGVHGLSVAGSGVLGEGPIGTKGITSGVAGAKAVSGVATPGVTAVGNVVAVHGSINGTISGGTQQAAVLGDASAATATGVPMAGVWGIGPIGGTLFSAGVYGVGGADPAGGDGGRFLGSIGVVYGGRGVVATGGAGGGVGAGGAGADVTGGAGPGGGSGIKATGGDGVAAPGGAGIEAYGGDSSAGLGGRGIYGIGGNGATTGNSQGGYFIGGSPSGAGIAATGGAPNGPGVRATGTGTGYGVVALGGVHVDTGVFRWDDAAYVVRRTTVDQGVAAATIEVAFAGSDISHSSIAYAVPGPAPTFDVPVGTYRVTYKMNVFLNDLTAGTKVMTSRMTVGGVEYDSMTSRTSIDGPTGAGVYSTTLTATSIKVVAAPEVWKFTFETDAAGTGATVLAKSSMSIERLPDNA